MAHGIKTLSASQTGYLAVVQWYHQSVRQRMFLCSAGLRAVAGATYQPKILFVSDVVCDAGGESRFALLLNQHGPFAVYAGEDGDTTGTSHASLADVLRTYPNIYAQGTVTLFLEGRSDDTTTTTTAQEMVAAIRAITNAGLNSVTMECEQVDEFESKTVPLRRVDASTIYSGETLVRDFDGTPFPVAHGPYEIGQQWTLPGWLKYATGVLGWRPPLQSAVPRGKYTAGSTPMLRAVFTEASSLLARQSVGTANTYVDVNGTLSLLYSAWVDGNGDAHWGTDGVTTSFRKEHTVELRENPWAYYPVVPMPVTDSYNTAANAVDGDPDTYASIQPSGSLLYDIPSVSPAGRISCNSTDAGNTTNDKDGVGRPVGLKVLVLFVAPPGEAIPADTASQTVAFGWTDATGFHAWQGATVTVTPPQTALGVTVAQVNVPYMVGGDPVTGWCGTQFHEWRFETTQRADATDPDSKLAVSGTAYQNRPFKIKITNADATAYTHTAAVVFLVGCRIGQSVVRSLYQLSNVQTGIRDRDRKLVVTGIIADPWLTPTNPVGGRHFWDRPGGALSSGRLVDRTFSPVSSVRASTPTYMDDVSGTFTGTASATLTDPIHHARHILQAWGGVTSAEIATSAEFGSYTSARTAIRNWYSSGAAERSWDSNHQSVDVSSVRDQMLIHSDVCMGLRVSKMPNGKYGFFHWIPVVALPASRRYDSLTPIDVRRKVVAIDGVPQIDTSRGDRRVAVNRLEVIYRGDVRRKATCDKTGSDDGYEREWAWDIGGVLPYSNGMTPQQLCQLSVDRYGETPFPFQVNLPGIYVPRVAVAQAMYLLASQWEPPVSLRMTATPALYDLWPGHVFRLSNDLETVLGSKPVHWGPGVTWESIYWVCERNEQRSDGGAIVQEITATCLPYRVGDMTRGGVWGGRDGEEDAILEGE